MKAKLSSYYRKNGGIMVFVYLVVFAAGAAGDTQKADYQAAQGSNYREDADGNALFFSTRPLSTNRAELIALTVTPNGRVVADDLTKVLTQAEKLDDYILQEQAKLMAQRAVLGQGVTGVSNLTSTRPIEAPAFDIPVEIEQDIPA